MRIKVNELYMGYRSNNQKIHPGEYEVGDPALFGAEDYLVNVQQIAAYLDAPAEETVTPQVETVEPPPEVVDEIEFKGRKVQRRKGQDS